MFQYLFQLQLLLKEELLQFKFEGEGFVHVPVSRALKTIEQRILTCFDDTLSWRLSVSPAQTFELFNDQCGWPVLPDIEEFKMFKFDIYNIFWGYYEMHFNINLLYEKDIENIVDDKPSTSERNKPMTFKENSRIVKMPADKVRTISEAARGE